MKLKFNEIFNRKTIKPSINYSVFENKSILITGGRGSIAKKLFKALSKKTKNIECIDIEMDVTIAKNINKLNKKYYDFVFHLAADKRATIAEEKPADVTMQNIISTRNITKLKFGKIIFASTCKAANPITSYGSSKLICERIILNTKKGIVARFVNVFDTSFSVTKIWGDIKTGPLPVTDCIRYFIQLDEAVDLLLACASQKIGRYSFYGLKKYKMIDIAKKIYPKRKIKIVPLRFGDRPIEKLVSNFEKSEKINKSLIKITDCWGV